MLQPLNWDLPAKPQWVVFLQDQLTPRIVIAVLIWLGVLTATPITLWVAGEAPFPVVASLGVLAQFAATVLALSLTWSWRRIVLVTGTVAVMTWAAEFIGHSTGFPFGHYYYSELLQPQVGGVPLLIPLAWMMMLGPAWAVALSITGSRQRVVIAIGAALALTVWDFYLDPQMVSKGLWIWENPGGYFGIPWVNYAGWLLTSGLITLVIHPSEVERVPLLLIYTFTWIFQAIGLGVFWGQPGPALVGFVTMGLFSVWAWRKEYTAWQQSSPSPS